MIMIRYFSNDDFDPSRVDNMIGGNLNFMQIHNYLVTINYSFQTNDANFDESITVYFRQSLAKQVWIVTEVVQLLSIE